MWNKSCLGRESSLNITLLSLIRDAFTGLHLALAHGLMTKVKMVYLQLLCLVLYTCISVLHIFFIILHVHLSGWPSGLRRQTQGNPLPI